MKEVPGWIKPFFVFAALYDGILGVAFLALPLKLFELAGVTPPNHLGYIHFPALLLILFAIMFFNIAKNPIGNRILIHYGIMLKICYCSVVFSHWLMGNMPNIWITFGVFDLVFLVVFIIALNDLKA